MHQKRTGTSLQGLRGKQTLRSKGARTLAKEALEVCSMLLLRSIRKSKPAHAQGCSHMLLSPFHVSLGNSDRTKSKLERTMCLMKGSVAGIKRQSQVYIYMQGARVHCGILCFTFTAGTPPAWQAIFRAAAAQSCAWPPRLRHLNFPHLQCKPSQPASGRYWFVFALSQLHVQLRACMGGVLDLDNALGRMGTQV